MTRYECDRCHTTCFTTDPPHLCKDLKERYERQRQAVGLVVPILDRWVNGNETMYDNETMEEIALEIIKRIAGRDLGT